MGRSELLLGVAEDSVLQDFSPLQTFYLAAFPVATLVFSGELKINEIPFLAFCRALACGRYLGR